MVDNVFTACRLLIVNTGITIGCQLEDGQILHGQNDISHPSFATSAVDVTKVDKEHTNPLPAKIHRVFYLNEDKQVHPSKKAAALILIKVIEPTVNPVVLHKIDEQGGSNGC